MSSFYSASFTAHLNVMENVLVLFMIKDQLLARLCRYITARWSHELQIWNVQSMKCTELSCLFWSVFWDCTSLWTG